MREDSIFTAALERIDPVARAAFLNDVCASDPELRHRVETLLEAYSRIGDFLEKSSLTGVYIDAESLTEPGTALRETEVPTPQPDPPAPGEEEVPPEATFVPPDTTFDAAIAGPTAGERPGARIGPYKLITKIGEGGMGVVYHAEQETPVRRSVALKIIKPGLDTEQIVLRFQAERQALALMDHPNIAKVLDAGATSSGRPYFVMELVMGTPITEYCDRARLTPRERIALLVPICQAIQHAHQKGIIHRDIKPSNLLVTLRDGKPVPQVIDFGIAKAIDRELDDKTLVTQLGTIVGTLEYMSPEQAEPGAPDVDTRSDVYSLGVLLYELLTGTTPLERRTLRHAALAEVLRRIREEEPPRPSTRLNQSREALAAIAELRQTDGARLPRLIRGELDWIVMKALEKNRTRRYETANGLARDLERYLQDEPVEASPPSPTYRLFKTARKHRVLLGTAAAFTGLLVLGAAVSTSLAVRATRAEHLALKERDAAAAARRRADREAATAQAINTFLQEDLLAQASAMSQSRHDVSPDPNIQVRTLLDRASERIAGKFPGQPEVEASIRMTIGSTYRRLGIASARAKEHLERAIALDRQALGAEHPETLRAMTSLGAYFLSQGQWEQAEPLFTRVLEVCRRTLGPEHKDTLNAMMDLAAVYHEQGKPKLAEPLFAKALDVARRTLGEEHADTLAAMASLGWFYKRQNKPELAEPLLTRALEVRLRTLGLENPATLWNQVILAGLYRDQGKPELAEPLFTEALEVSRRTLGVEHRDSLWALAQLAVFYRQQDRPTLAEPLFLELIQVRRRTLGAAHPNTLTAVTQLQSLLLSQAPGVLSGSPADQRLIVDVLSEAHRLSPANSSLAYRLTLAQLLAGDRDGARRTCDETRKRYSHSALASAGLDPAGALDLSQAARLCLLDPGPNALADPSVPLRLAEAAVAADRTSRTLYVLALAHYRARQHDEAIRYLHLAIESHPRSLEIPLSWPVLALAHQRLGHPAEAAEWLQKALGPPADPTAKPTPAILNPHTTPWLWAEFTLLRREARTQILDDSLPGDPFQHE